MRAWLGDSLLFILCLASWIAIVVLGSRLEQINVFCKSLQEKIEIIEQVQIDGGR